MKQVEPKNYLIMKTDNAEVMSTIKNNSIPLPAKILIIIFLASIILFGIKHFTGFEFYLNETAKKEETQGDYSRPTDVESNCPAIPAKIPSEVNFAGKKVPIQNMDVYEHLDDQLQSCTFRHSVTFLSLKRSKREFAIIEPILKKHGIPDDLKYIAVLESRLSPDRIIGSSVGIWQLSDKTAKKFGLEINNYVDERFHVQKSTEAICKYLKSAYEIYKDWILVAAAYKFGSDELTAQLKRQNVTSYYDLLFSSYSQTYVYNLIAYKLIFENPLNYNFNVRPKDYYRDIPVDYVKVNSSVTDFVEFAKKYATNYKVLKNLNPWLRQKSLINNSKTTYYIAIPKKGSRNLNYSVQNTPSDTIVYKE